ncbi:hypothetical protein K2173_006024 [Erythroxylum novogranatense]|uniref:Uncharacterized protein n=1 Tax=Erythroxylum novogranatense TaxID=1862640 RepID=A0AAV8TDI9_9ROSI|nr:hypothetical protein K2173_006024 [Erythroxylum novogranatense]
MAACHVRSISLASRSHPMTASIEDRLDKLKATDSGSIFHKIVGLKDLYKALVAFLQLPTTQQTLSHAQHSKCVQDALNGSLRLLDTCETTTDAISQMKQCMQELQSSLRRKRGGEGCLTGEINAFCESRKLLNKVACKCLRTLRKDRICTTNLDANSNQETLINKLRNVEETGLSAFGSILSLISQAQANLKQSGWSTLSKFFQSKSVSCESNVSAFELEKIDAELLILKSSKGVNFVAVQNVLKGLEALESKMLEMEEELAFVYRQLLKTRVSLLNILNN